MQEKNMGHICPIGRSWVNDPYSCIVVNTLDARTLRLEFRCVGPRKSL